LFSPKEKRKKKKKKKKEKRKKKKEKRKKKKKKIVRTGILWSIGSAFFGSDHAIWPIGVRVTITQYN
jgi:hypothetical protein